MLTDKKCKNCTFFSSVKVLTTAGYFSHHLFNTTWYTKKCLVSDTYLTKKNPKLKYVFIGCTNAQELGRQTIYDFSK